MLDNRSTARTLPGVTVAASLAHQGGWDEILLIAGPMVAIGWLLVVAKRRVDAAAAANRPKSKQPQD